MLLDGRNTYYHVGRIEEGGCTLVVKRIGCHILVAECVHYESVERSF